MNLTERPRRLRKSGFLRELVAENRVTVNDFITPLFITAGSGIEVEISSMPGYFKRSLDLTVEHAKLLASKEFACLPEWVPREVSTQSLQALEQRFLDDQGLHRTTVEAMQLPCGITAR